jgi:kumamolisin
MATTIPPGHGPLRGSEQGQPEGARSVGPQPPDEQMIVHVVLRRRTDRDAEGELGARLRTHPLLREPLTADEFGSRFGASQDDIHRVAAYLRAGGLTIAETHAPSRTVLAAGTAETFSRLFSIELGRYEAPMPASAGRRGQPAGTQAYRSHTGPIYVPDELAELIMGVFGLDDRNISRRNGSGDPPTTNPTSVWRIMDRYNFPTNSAEGQTIAIFAAPALGPADTAVCGYVQSDIDAYYAALPANLGFTAPVPLDASVDGTASYPAAPDSEATQDICISSTVAQGAAIAVYLNSGRTTGWLKVLKMVTFPSGGDPVPSVLSSSFYIAPGDDPDGLKLTGITTSFLTCLSGKFADAGAQGVTVCVASGDSGAECGVPDGAAHVQYPGSDPNILSCGGTTVGAGPTGPVEWVWNDMQDIMIGGTDYVTPGATGGGVSAFFPLPSWQSPKIIPKPLQADRIIGRGLPDVAGNASWNSGYYPMYTIGMDPNPWNGSGTSAVAPLYAGLFAVINAALALPVGYINPTLYELGDVVCADINPGVVGGPKNNTFSQVTGYPAGPGWDACTGWGTINGTALLEMIRQLCALAAHKLIQSAGVDNQAVQAKATQLRRLRDEHLPQTGPGRQFVELVTENATALARIMLGDETAYGLAVDALAPWIAQPSNADMLAATIDAENVARLQLLIDHLTLAMPGQASTLRSLQARLADSAGMTVIEMLGHAHQ